MSVKGSRADRCGGGDRGGSPVEMAILWPVIVLVLFAAPQIGSYFAARAVALTAAQTAVTTERQLGAEPGSGKPAAEQFLAAAGDWLGPPTGQQQVSDPVHTDTGVSYTVRGQAISLVPWVSWDISQTAHGTREQFTTSPGGG